MPSATYQQISFTAGQLSEVMIERVDLPQRYKGVAEQDNFISTKQGPVIRRPGTQYVAETKSSEAGTITDVRLVDFEFSTDQTYILEFGDGYVRIYLNRGRLQEDGTVTLVGSDSDTPFELGSPYHELVDSLVNFTGSHAAGGFKSVSSQTYDSTEGVVTFNFNVSHLMEAGNIIKVEDTAAPADEVEGIFTVLENVDSDTLTYAKPSGGATGSLDVEVPDLATHTTGVAHGLNVGQYVTIKNLFPLAYNGTFLVERVPTTQSFVVRVDNGGVALADISGTGVDAITGNDTSVGKLDWKQSADVLFLTHPNVKPKELQRKSNFAVISGTYSGTTLRCNLIISTGDSPHAFQANNPVRGVHSKVIVSGVTPTQFNGCFTIDAVTENSISYTPTSTPTGDVTSVGQVDGWQIVDFVNRDGPYLDQNEDESHNFTTLATTRRPGELTSGMSPFSFLDVGRIFRFFNSDSKVKWGSISWIDDIASVLYDDLDVTESRNADEDETKTAWWLGAWSTGIGWPRTIGFIQSRSVYGGNAFGPQTLWLSESNNINGFQPTDFFDDLVTDDMGINLTIDDAQVNAIHWLMSSKEGLLIGTKSSEFLLQGRAKFDPITPTNAVITSQSSIGSKEFIRPVRTGENSIIFVQTAGRKIYQTIFDIDSEASEPKDITQLAGDITTSGVETISFQKEPNPILWAILGDGSLIGCSYEIGENVIGWHKHTIGGTDVAVKSIATISDSSGDKPRDQLWALIERTINSETVQYIEYINDEYETGDDLEDAIYMDSAFTYDSTATTTITGLGHLEGETVKVFGDGVAQSDQTVSSSQITVTSASKVQLGLGNTAKLTILPVALRAAQPDSYQKVQRLESANISFLNAQGVEFGISETDIEPVEFDDSTSLHTGLIENMGLKSSNERTQQLFLVNSSVFPSTIRSIEIDLEVQPVQS